MPLGVAGRRLAPRHDPLDYVRHLLMQIGAVRLLARLVMRGGGILEKIAREDVWPRPMSKTAPRQTARTELSDALRRCRSAVVGIGLFSCLINILMLTAPLLSMFVIPAAYMLLRRRRTTRAHGSDRQASER